MIIITILFVVITILIIRSVTKPKNYPPGPPWYPITGCGNIIQKMSKKHGSQWKAMSVLAKQHATEVLGLKLGSELVVVIYGVKNCRETLTDPSFDGRPDNFFTRLRSFGKRMGITFTDGPLWKEHRQFTVRHLKHVGFGKTVMELEIQRGMKNVINDFMKSNGKPINPKTVLAPAVIDALWKYVAGEKIGGDRLQNLLNLLSARCKAFTMTGGWLNEMPWCRFLFPDSSGYNLILKLNKEVSDVLEETIYKHNKNLIEGEDFIYSFLKEMETTNKKEMYTDDHLKVILWDILIAGSQTTSNVLDFALIVLLKDATLQKKIFEEISTVIGDKTPCWEDSFRLVYVSAFLLEVQRYYTIAPLVGPRRVLDDYVIDGYRIPKDTTVIMSVGDIHMDKDIFENPEEFRPERFIDESGALKSSEDLYTFGLGRRRCPGDSLGKSFMFIMFVGIVQHFIIKCEKVPSDERVVGILAAAKPFTAQFIPRK